MRKHELLKIMDSELMDKLFGFCYTRTSDSYEAQELCSDIVYALIKAASGEGEIKELYPFIWRVARNVYADFCEKRRKQKECMYQGDAEELLLTLVTEEDDDDEEILRAVYRRISFLTKAYREVMISYYLDGLSVAEIAKRQKTSEVAIRQRLFSARKKIKSEVEEMTDNSKPMALKKIEFEMWGTGNPSWGDPWETCGRQFSKHILWICKKSAKSATEIAEELNVPTVYVEEELDILTRGVNGEYGLLRRLDNGRYAINLVLFDEKEMEEANQIYMEYLPLLGETVARFMEEKKGQYLMLPYLNKKVDFNLILWQQMHFISHIFSKQVANVLKEKYFVNMKEANRQFSVYGYVDSGKCYGGGCDDIWAENICGYSKVFFSNIYITRIHQHFHCGHNISQDAQLQLAIRAIDGLSIDSLTEQEKEQAAKAVECGYLRKEGGVLYTKILVGEGANENRAYELTKELSNGYFDEEAEVVAEKIAKFIKRVLPEHLLPEWGFANALASLPVLDALVEVFIKKGLLVPPEDGVGAEGCWMVVEK